MTDWLYQAMQWDRDVDLAAQREAERSLSGREAGPGVAGSPVESALNRGQSARDIDDPQPRPESELRYQVEALCDRVAADLLDRTGTELTIPQFAELSTKLVERNADLIEELLK